MGKWNSYTQLIHVPGMLHQQSHINIFSYHYAHQFSHLKVSI